MTKHEQYEELSRLTLIAKEANKNVDVFAKKYGLVQWPSKSISRSNGTTHACEDSYDDEDEAADWASSAY